MHENSDHFTAFCGDSSLFIGGSSSMFYICCTREYGLSVLKLLTVFRAFCYAAVAHWTHCMPNICLANCQQVVFNRDRVPARSDDRIRSKISQLNLISLTFFFRFKAKAMHISGLLKDRRRTPLQETCDWLEYVLRHGGARHLRAQVFNIPWYQYYLLDVMAFLVAIVTLVVMVIRLACRCMCRVCCKKGDDKNKKE